VSALRIAGVADAEALAVLHAGAFERPWGTSEFSSLLAAPGAYGLIADGAGFILCWVQADEAEILAFGVLPAQRRAGLGSALLSQALSTAVARGARRVLLEVATDNSGALALYRGFGFEQVGLRPGYYAGPNGRADAVVMALSL
jgi:ribosomal-protein-alanine N-acetyltransferase